MHLNVDLLKKCKCLVDCIILGFLYSFFFMKSALSFCVSFLISNDVSLLRFFSFTVGNFNTFQRPSLLQCICLGFLNLCVVYLG